MTGETAGRRGDGVTGETGETAERRPGDGETGRRRRRKRRETKRERELGGEPTRYCNLTNYNIFLIK